jgi:hypothetical protein
MDPSGAVIPGAQVLVTNAAMGFKTDLTTNADGIYRAPLLSPGKYQIEVTLQGFKKAVRDDVDLRTGDTLAHERRAMQKTVEAELERGGGIGEAP